VARPIPDNGVGLQALWWALSLKGAQKETLEAAKAYLMVNYNDHAIEAALDQGYAQGGYAAGMKQGAQALSARFRASFALPVDIAGLYLDAGDKVQALDWLEKGFDVRDPNMPYLGIPYFERLRSELRFQALMRRLNLPK
jgi:hypothetical protein